MCNVLETASILALSESYHFWISVVKWFTLTKFLYLKLKYSNPQSNVTCWCIKEESKS